MTIGTSELISIITLLAAFVAWVNNAFIGIDKRFDKTREDINGLGGRLTLFEQGTSELLEEKINQLKSKIFDLESAIEISTARREAPPN
jgi:hypothetical protein